MIDSQSMILDLEAGPTAEIQHPLLVVIKVWWKVNLFSIGSCHIIMFSFTNITQYNGLKAVRIQQFPNVIRNTRCAY